MCLYAAQLHQAGWITKVAEEVGGYRTRLCFTLGLLPFYMYDVQQPELNIGWKM